MNPTHGTESGSTVYRIQVVRSPLWVGINTDPTEGTGVDMTHHESRENIIVGTKL